MKFVTINLSGDLCARLLPGTEYIDTELDLAYWVTNGDSLPQEALDGYYVAEYFPDGKYLGPDADGVEPVFTLRSAETEADVHAMIKMLEGYGPRFIGHIPTDTAHDWIDHDFTADSAAEWCEIGVWDPATAADLVGAGLSPCQIEETAKQWTNRDVIYEACNGDLDVQELIDTMREALSGVEDTAVQEYQIAVPIADGSWDVLERFEAEDDDAANEYAETHYDGQDWYVLDAAGKNINGGRDQVA